MANSNADFTRILEILTKHGVKFIVVGGVCGVLHGAPLTTFDLDVVHSRKSDNLERLLKALEELDARFRGQGKRLIRPGLSHISSKGHQLLMTEHGPLDLLGSVSDDQDFDDLKSRTTLLALTRTHKIRVLDLDALIEVKRRLGRDKDLASLAALENTLKERKA